MKRIILLAGALLLAIADASSAQVNVVTTLPDYADFARRIGGDRVTVDAIVKGDQDAHFIRPKPSFVGMVARADLLVSTGLDLELWLPTVVNKSGNARVRSGKTGYCAAAHGMRLLEKPTTMSRVEGGVHIHGNPHVTCSPINMVVAIHNIAAGLTNADPDGKAIYEAGRDRLVADLDRRLFGEKLVSLLGGKTLRAMAEKGTLIPFLEKKSFRGTRLIEHLGGWMKQMMPLRGKPIVTYHKNWIYFVRLFGLTELGTIEPKPGIPPSPKHVTGLISLMDERDVKIVLAANYFDEQKVRSVADAVGAEPVIVPLYVGGAYGVDSYVKLVDHWVSALLEAARKGGLISQADRAAPPGMGAPHV